MTDSNAPSESLGTPIPESLKRLRLTGNISHGSVSGNRRDLLSLVIGNVKDKHRADVREHENELAQRVYDEVCLGEPIPQRRAQIEQLPQGWLVMSDHLKVTVLMDREHRSRKLSFAGTRPLPEKDKHCTVVKPGHLHLLVCEFFTREMEFDRRVDALREALVEAIRTCKTAYEFLTLPDVPKHVTPADVEWLVGLTQPKQPIARSDAMVASAFANLFGPRVL